MESGIIHLVCLFVFSTLGGCTINIYHASPTSSGVGDDSLLVIPQAPMAQAPLPEVSMPEASMPQAPVPQVHEREIENTKQTVTLEKSTSSVLSMQATGSSGETIRYMDTVDLKIQVMVDAYLNCYYQPANGDIIKVFPNRYAARYWVYAGQQLTLPDAQKFQFIADRRGGSEAFLCLASTDDIMSGLPKMYRANVFQQLPVQSFDAMYAMYKRSTQGNLVGQVISYQIQ